MVPLTGQAWRFSVGLALAIALVAIVPTTGDIGLTWDEPAYRYCQLMTGQWWEELGKVRSAADLKGLLEADTLLYYWPHGRHGMNFHPPLAGQMNLLTYELFGEWLLDVAARRLATALEYAAAVTLLFGFLARRYGVWAGTVAGLALMLMPRVYGDGHVIGTDMPGMLLWGLTAFAFWKGLTEEKARRWRALVGVLLGLCFLEKMAAVMVLLPLMTWLIVGHLFPAFRRATRWDWLDGLFTTAILAAPIGVAFREVLRLAALLPEPKVTNLFIHRPEARFSGWVLAVPLGLWLVRRLLGRLFLRGKLWGVERPALETWAAILAFGPVLAWLGNPAWWRETMPRLAHYYLLNTNREGSLPDIRIIYFGETYLFSLPWHNGWVLLGLTVPVGILTLGLTGAFLAVFAGKANRLPLFLLVNFVTIPILRMLPTPAHDGVRLMLPTFFFLAALAGYAAHRLAGSMSGFVGHLFRALVFLMVAGALAHAGRSLVSIHPFELSYYNELIGGPTGAWRRGLELNYWYDGFDAEALRAINAKPMPDGSYLGPPNVHENVPTFHELQSLGLLRDDLRLDGEPRGAFPFEWLLTHDSKADPFSRLLFVMTPWYERRPEQLQGARVASIADPTAVSRAFALTILASASGPPAQAQIAPLPDWVARTTPFLARFWGQGLTLAQPRPGVNGPLFGWARESPEGLRAAAKALARREETNDAVRLKQLLTRGGDPAFERALENVLTIRPQALVEAAEVLITRPEHVRAVLLRQGYTDPETIGGPLDVGLASFEDEG